MVISSINQKASLSGANAVDIGFYTATILEFGKAISWRGFIQVAIYFKKCSKMSLALYQFKHFFVFVRK